MTPKQGLLLATGVAAVSFSAIFIRVADAPSLSIAFYRNAISAAILMPLLLRRRRKELRGLDRREFAVALGAGALLALHFVLWISSLSYTTIAASVVLVTTNPIFVAAAERALFGIRVSRTTLTGILLGFGGAIIVSGGDFALSGRAFGGDLLALGGAVAAAGYFVAGRRLRQRVSLLTYTGVVYTTSALLLLPIALIAGAPLTGFPSKSWLMFLLQALVPQMMGHTIFNYLLKDVEATIVAVAILGEPVGSTILALALFGEVPSWSALVGGALILIGIYIAMTAQARARRGRGPLSVPVE